MVAAIKRRRLVDAELELGGRENRPNAGMMRQYSDRFRALNSKLKTKN